MTVAETTQDPPAVPEPATLAPAELAEECAALRWLQAEVRAGRRLPTVEPSVIVRSLQLLMHREEELLLPLLRDPDLDTDDYLVTHALNVAVLSMALAEDRGLVPEDVRRVGLAGLLCDIGTLRTPPEILSKPGPLDARELKTVRQHPITGARLVIETDEYLELAATVAYEHHIQVNGDGYPRMRHQRQSHFGTRLVQVCDVFDAACSPRPHRTPLGEEAALDFIKERTGGHFDPRMAGPFSGLYRRLQHRVVLTSAAEAFGDTPAADQPRETAGGGVA